MVIQRDQYVSELLSKRWNGKVKIITGIRRCGKSFLLSTLYKDFFRKIVILDGNAKAWTDEDGIVYVGVIPFLLGETEEFHYRPQRD